MSNLLIIIIWIIAVVIGIVSGNKIEKNRIERIDRILVDYYIIQTINDYNIVLNKLINEGCKVKYEQGITYVFGDYWKKRKYIFYDRNLIKKLKSLSVDERLKYVVVSRDYTFDGRDDECKLHDCFDVNIGPSDRILFSESSLNYRIKQKIYGTRIIELAKEDNVQTEVLEKNLNRIYEKYKSDSMAVIPISAFYLDDDGIGNWIIACGWETDFGQAVYEVGHIKLIKFNRKSEIVNEKDCD